MSLDTMFRMSLWPIAMCNVLLIVGCAGQQQKEVALRQRSVESLWDVLQDSYVYFEVRQNITGYRAFALSKVTQAKTRREYVVALANALSLLSDTHVSITNLQEWWRRAEGTELRPACSVCLYAGGYVWIAFSPEQVVVKGGESPPSPQAIYQLLDVEGVPASSLAVELLFGEPDSVIPISVVLLDGRECRLALRVPKEIPSAPASQPTTRPATSQPTLQIPPGFTLAPFFGPLVPSFGKGGVASMRVGDVGYIALENLRDKDTVEEFDKALDGLLDTKALILDLRWNMGGNVEVTTLVLSRFVSSLRPYGLIQQRNRGYLIGLEMPIWYSLSLPVLSRGTTYHKPLVVLIDTSTASGGELLAFGLQDSRGAVLVGHRTLGAGAALGYVQLPDGLTIQYSTMPLRRLDGRAYQYVGVPPDYAIEIDRASVCSKGYEALVAYYLETFSKGLEIAKERAAKWGGSPASQPAANKGK